MVVLAAIVLGLVVAALLSWNSTPTEYVEEGVPERIVAGQEAREIAQSNLSLFESWKEPVLAESYTFYDLTKTPSAYLFVVKDLYGKAGYVTVSASTRFQPVIDISLEATTPVVNMINVRNDLVRNTNYEPNDVKTELIYVGGADYYGKFTFRESAEIEDSYFILNYAVPTQITPDLLQTKHDFYKDYSSDSAQEMWDALKE